MFQRNFGFACCLILAGYSLFSSEDGGCMYLQISVNFNQTTQHYIPEDNILHCLNNELLKNTIPIIILQ
jgi:hypothetical protein